MSIYCKEWYLINCATTGLALTDAAFLTDKSGNAKDLTGKGAYPPIYSALGVEALAAGAATNVGGYVTLAPTGVEGMDPVWDRWSFPVPFYSLRTTEIDQPYWFNEAFDRHQLNIPYPNGSTLVDGTYSKAFGVAANTYLAFVLYQLEGAPCIPSRWPNGGKVQVVAYDKGSDVTTVIWETMENAAQNTAGELRKDHLYRLLWGSFTAQAMNDTEALMARVTVPGYPALTFPGSGGFYNPLGARRIWFLKDSITMKGDAVHKVEGHLGTTCRPLVHLAWEDMGKVA